jgi:hypothetical protein
VNVSVGEFVGEVLGFAVSVGGWGAFAANAPQAAQTPTVRTASSATSANRLAFLVALLEIQSAIKTLLTSSSSREGVGAA